MAAAKEPNLLLANEVRTSKPPLHGKYYYASSDNVDEYLIGLGVGLVLRKVHQVATPSLEIIYSEDNQTWTIRLESVFHKHILNAKFGEEVEDETFDVRPCTTILRGTLDETKLTMRQRCEEGPNVETVFEKTDHDTITLTMVSSKYKAVQIFKARTGVPQEVEEDDEDCSNE